MASLHVTASPALTNDNNSVSKRHSGILKLGQAMPRLIWSLSQETLIFSKCLFTSEKMDPPPPGKLVQRQGGLEAQHDLSTPPPPHSVKKSVSKVALNQAMHGAEHGYPISWTTVFTICFATSA